MNQVILGMLIPFLLAAGLYAWRGFRASLSLLILLPGWMALGALWAVAPDLPRLWGDHELYRQLSNDPRCNVFFWHTRIDQVETDSPLFMILAVLIFAGLLAAAWRELAIEEAAHHD
jgi:hypothetical protein